jgi:hypothetical protein
MTRSTAVVVWVLASAFSQQAWATDEAAVEKRTSSAAWSAELPHQPPPAPDAVTADAEVTEADTAVSDEAAPAPRGDENASPKRGGGLLKPALIVAGGTAAGAGVGLMRRSSEGGANQPPIAEIVVVPGQTIGVANATTFSFHASASDPDGTVKSYSWDFGDGASGSGATAQHRYASPGTFDVRLTVSDGDGAAQTASASVEVGSLTGRWEWLIHSWERCERIIFTLTQTGASVSGSAPSAGAPVTLTGTLLDEHIAELRFGERPLTMPPTCQNWGTLPGFDATCGVSRDLAAVFCHSAEGWTAVLERR